MGKIIKSISELVGNTPLMELVKYEQNHQLDARLLAKLEYFNPSGSVKDRAALNMIENAEKEGLIHPGDTIVENSSGNTGIGLAAFAASRGYHLEIFLENGVSKEREQILRAYGATLHYHSDLPAIKKMQDEGFLVAEKFMAAFQEYCDEQEGNYFFINQLNNKHNYEAHIKTTGPELWEATDGNIDILVAMVGTAGTLYGLSTYLRGKNPNIEIYGAQPDAWPSKENPNVDIIDGVMLFDGIPQEGRPPFLEADTYKECINVSAEKAYEVARELARTEGLFIGTSAAAATVAATILAKRPENAGKTIVIMMADNGMKYLSTNMYK